jgi:hypothetical protein
VWLEELGKLEKINDPIGNEAHDLPACSIMLQPTTLPLGPIMMMIIIIITILKSYFL